MKITFLVLLFTLFVTKFAQGETIDYHSEMSPDGQKITLLADETGETGDLASFYKDLGRPESTEGGTTKKNFSMSNEQLVLECSHSTQGTSCAITLHAGTESKGSHDWSTAKVENVFFRKIAYLTCTGSFEAQIRGLLPEGNGTGKSYVIHLSPKASISFVDRQASGQFNVVTDK